MSAFSERLQPETNTFHLPFCDMTITLDDVVTILKISVTGNLVSVLHLIGNEARDLLCHLLGVSIIEVAGQIAETQGVIPSIQYQECFQKFWVKIKFIIVSGQSAIF